MKEFFASLLLIITSWFTGKPAQPIQPTPVIISPTVTVAPTPTPDLDLSKDSYADPERKGWRRVKIETEVGEISVSYPDRWSIEKVGGSFIFNIQSDDFKYEGVDTLATGGNLQFYGIIDSAIKNKFNDLDQVNKYKIDLNQISNELKSRNIKTEYIIQKLANLDWVIEFKNIEGDPNNAAMNKYYYGSLVNFRISGECNRAKQDQIRMEKYCDEIINSMKFDFNK